MKQENIHRNLEQNNLYINRFWSGVYKNRSPLFIPLSQMGLQIIQKLDTLWDGLNTEISPAMTLVRRPGFLRYCAQGFIGTEFPLTFYSFQNLTGAITPLVDTQYAIYSFSTGSLSSIYTKQTQEQSSFVGVNNMLYWCDGTSCKKWDGTTVTNIGIVAPPSAPTLSFGSGSLSPLAGYQYGYCYRNSSTGHLSTMSPASANTGPQTSKNITVGYSASTDPQVNKIWLFRTDDGGADYYFLAEVSNATSSYTDSTPDDGLNSDIVAPVADANNPPPTQTGSNIVINPGFELGSQGWRTASYASYLSNSANAHSGNGYLQISGSASYETIFNSTYVPCAPGQTYTVSGWIYIQAYAGNMEVDVSALVLEADQVTVVAYEGALANTATVGSWQFVTHTFTVPANGAYLQVYCEANGGSGTPGACTIRFDDLSLVNNSTTFGLLVWYAGRLWGAVGDTLYFSGGPDTTEGVGEEAWPPANNFTVPGNITALAATSSGLVVNTTDDAYVVAGTNITTFTVPQLWQKNFGVATQNSVTQDGDNLFFFTTRGQVFNYSANGLVEIGFPIEKQLGAFNPANVYLTLHRNGSDEGLFVSDGSSNIWRYSMAMSCWSPVAQPMGNVNYISYSQAFTNAAWVGNSNGVSTPTVTDNVVVAPDGTTTAATVVYPAVTGGEWSGWAQGNIPLVPGGQTATFSVYLKAASSCTVNLVVESDDSSSGGYPGASVTCNVTTSWQRFSVTNTWLSSDADTGVNIHVRKVAANTASTIDVWGAQLEYGSTPTAYSATTTAATSGVTQGVGCISSIEVTPGDWLMLMGRSVGAGYILSRSTSTFSDDGNSYSAWAVVGSLITAAPRQVAIVNSILIDATAVGTYPTVSVLLNEISGTFTALPNPVGDPAQLAGTTYQSSSVWMKRHDLKAAATPLPQQVRHLQVKIDFGNIDTVQNELLGLCVV